MPTSQVDVTPEQHYRNRLASVADDEQQLSRRSRTLTVALVLVALFTAVLAWQAWLGELPVYPAALSLIADLVLISRILDLRFTRMYRLQRLTDALEASLARATGQTTQTGLTGEEFREPGHLYDRDLDILGTAANPVSLFGLLATVRTHLAQRRLAETLLHPPPAEHTAARQRAIQTLAPRTGLRERIALLGNTPIHQIPATLFDAWLDEPSFTVPRATLPVLFVTTSAIVGLLALGLAHIVQWPTLEPNLAAVLAIQSAVALYLRPRILSPMERASRLASPTALLREALALLAAEDFTHKSANESPNEFADKSAAPTLSALQPLPEALKTLGQLHTQLTLLEQRTKEWFYLPCLLFAVGTRATVTLEDWKRHHAADLRRWLAAWAEFETLNALATYAFEHPADSKAPDSEDTGPQASDLYAYPQILPADHPPTFEALHLAHPLLPSGAVANDILLGEATGTSNQAAGTSNEATGTPNTAAGTSNKAAESHTHHAGPRARFYLISGSNMAGKSTLLRTIGTNLVLAYAGAPIRATRARISPLVLGASLALTDSLADGRSKFLAEVERLSHIVTAARSGQPILFLIDEIFSGTNSLDRRAAAEAILTQLIAHRAIGALSTHDLTLTDLAEAPTLNGLNLHMASPNPDDPLAFDYLLKPGINTSSNALAILRMMHLEP